MEKEMVPQGWTTSDEMKSIDYMANDEPRRGTGKIPTRLERKRKLMAWLFTMQERLWPESVDVIKCYNHMLHRFASI